MDKQFTASEVREELNQTFRYRVNAMLNAFADLLEAQEKAVPVAWMHPDLHDGHPYPEECLNQEKIEGWLPLYAHSAQAQPPAASVPGAVEVSFEVWQDDEMVAECSGPEPSALHEATHYAAQYSQDGAVKLFRVSRVAFSAAQENPNG